jgi:hypothetical protein
VKLWQPQSSAWKSKPERRASIPRRLAIAANQRFAVANIEKNAPPHPLSSKSPPLSCARDRQFIHLQNGLRLLGHLRELRTIRAGIGYLMGHDQMVLGIDRELCGKVGDGAGKGKRRIRDGESRSRIH